MNTSHSDTHQECDAEVKRLAHRMVELVSEQTTHQVALRALISAYASVAVCHPCCALGAAHAARQIADLIETHAAPHDARHIH